MANITTPAGIPAAAKPDIKDVCATIGPAVLGDRWPAGVDPKNLTATQVGQIFELVTRVFWEQQIHSHKANAAAEAARSAVLATADANPFG